MRSRMRTQTKERFVMGLRAKLCGAVAALACLLADAHAQGTTQVLPIIDVWASRTGTGIIGASTSVITADEIARSPGLTIQDVLSREVGVQTWSTAGGTNGATTTVDLRGFGATASSNTLFLLNGRRLNDIDLLGVDLSTIPRDSIERIEISRGNSGAVLYGGGAVGGVINIITKTGVALPPTARVEGGFGSFNQREINGSAAISSGPFAASVFAYGVNSDGYRVNSGLRERTAIGDLRYTGDEGKAWAVISADDQHLGLPGARLVDQALGINELVTDRRGATTPTAFADKNGEGLTLGLSRIIGQGVELIVDGAQEPNRFFNIVRFRHLGRPGTDDSFHHPARDHRQSDLWPSHQDHDRHRLLRFNTRGQTQCSAQRSAVSHLQSQATIDRCLFTASPRCSANHGFIVGRAPGKYARLCPRRVRSDRARRCV